MTRGVRLYLVGSFVLVSLAGCGRGFFSEEREPWRAEAEIACLKSGAVKESADLVRINPISGPGVCGAEFPLKVAALGESNGSFGFADDDLRPPATIGNQPRWPASRNRLSAAAAITPRLIPTSRMRQAMAGPITCASIHAPSSGPISLTAPGVTPDEDEIELPPEGAPRGWQAGRPSALWRTARLSARTVMLRRRSASRRRRRLQSAPNYQPPRLGPGPVQPVAAFGPVAVKPAATLACPIVSVLDRWLADSVQPAAHALVRPARRRDQADLRLFLPRHERQSERAYFRTRLRQRARYRRLHARRRTAHLGEGRLARACRKSRAFCATCRRRACQQFTTVLAPGSNVYHYDHIHVDLMRRASRPADLRAGRGVRRGSRRARRRSAIPMLRASRMVTGSLGAQDPRRKPAKGQRGRRVRGRVGARTRLGRSQWAERSVIVTHARLNPVAVTCFAIPVAAMYLNIRKHPLEGFTT